MRKLSGNSTGYDEEGEMHEGGHRSTIATTVSKRRAYIMQNGTGPLHWMLFVMIELTVQEIWWDIEARRWNELGR